MTFLRLGSSQVDMQSRLYSIFQTLGISPPLVQQLQPKYLEARALYEARESPAKIYSWVALATSSMLVELPYAAVAGTGYWLCWYWPVGFPRDAYTAAMVWLFVLVMEFFMVGFGQAIAALSPGPLFASLLVPLVYQFIMRFCGAFVAPAQLAPFWRSWMYPLSPYHYLLEGMLSLVVRGARVRCNYDELAHFASPPGVSCEDYAGGFASRAGGYVEEVGPGMCGYCRFQSGEEFAASFSVYYDHHLRDFGISCERILPRGLERAADPTMHRDLRGLQLCPRVCVHLVLLARSIASGGICDEARERKNEVEAEAVVSGWDLRVEQNRTRGIF